MQTNKLRASAVAWILLVPLFMGLFFIGGSNAMDPPVLDETSWTKGIIDQSSDVKNIVSQDTDSNGYLYVSYYDNIGQNLMFATNSGGVWTTEIVDNSDGINGQYNSIAVGGDGTVHICYYDYADDCLRYAVKSTGVWAISVVGVDDSVGKYNSMVLDEDGNAHIVYQDAHDEVMKYANNVGGTWQISTLYGFNVYATALTITDDGILNTAFVGQNGKINYARLVAGNWTMPEIVDDAPGISPGVDIDVVDGKICVAYSSAAKGLKFAVRNDLNDWAKEDVDSTSSTVSWVSLDVDSLDRVHITYYSFPSLNYAKFDGVWSLSMVDENGGKCSSIVSDPNDKQHVVYIDAETVTSHLSYMTNSGARWISEVVDEGGDLDKVSSIVLDDDGNVHIAYFDDYEANNTTRGRLCYANDMDGWNVTVVDDSTAMTGLNPSIALDSAGWVHIAYFDNSVGQKVLKYVNNEGGNWSVPIILLPGTADVGRFSAIAVDGEGTVHIAYYYQGSKDLMYSNNRQGFWVPESIDNSHSVEGRVSLALNSSGMPQVAYYNDDGLMYAKRNATSWGSTMLDANNELGGGISLFIDAQDQSYITYHNEDLTLLKYINNVGGEWNNATIIASDGDVGADSAISVDQNGDEHIAYVESTGDGTLNYVERRSGIWMFQSVDVEGCGDRISMAMDAMGRAHVSYFDPVNKDLRYATVVSVPSAPTNLTVESEDGRLELSWQAPTNDGGSNITGYRIYWSNSTGGPFNLLAEVEADVTEYSHTGLTNGVTIHYRVRSVNSEGNSPYSNDGAGTPCVLPGAPNVDAEGKDKAVVLDWDAPDNGGAAIEKYNIYRKNETGVYHLIATVDGGVTYYKDTGLENGKEYFYYVTAVNPAGEGPESDPVSATPDEGMDTMLIIVIVIVVLAAVGVGVFFFLKKSGRI
jgi:hypothetical protein